MIDRNKDARQMNLPMHDMGEAFFAMATIEGADEHYFDGIHRHDFYEVLWFTRVKPRQAHFIDFNKYQIADQQVFLLLPDQVHSLDRKEKNGFVMAMSRDFFERLIGNDIFKLFQYSANFSVTLPEAAQPVMNTLLELIRQEYNGENRAAILESYLRSWFLHCIELQKGTGELPQRDPRLQTLIESIETNYRKQRKADFYANELSLSAKRLNELTRESFGKTISQMINDRLVLEAKREIGYVEKPIKEISYELGFSEPSYFTRFFGKQTGYAPEDFRKRMAGRYR